MRWLSIIICSLVMFFASMKYIALSSEIDFLYKKDIGLREKISALAPAIYPNAFFAHLSDTHIYDKRLGTDGAAFQKYLDNDRKMLIQSEEIANEAIKDIIAKKVDFVIISGDLTKDGEISSHIIFSKQLSKLKDAGINVFVVPGNHDVNNSHALRFIGDVKKPVAFALNQDFIEIYQDFGYKQAIYRDLDSLSYVVEPVDGLWLLALDSTKSRDNTMDKDPIVGGRFYPQTLKWMESILIKAVEQKKSVIAFFHHGLLEHYNGNSEFYPDYLLDSYNQIASMLAFYNVRIVFTGHFHANDISYKRFYGNKFVYDIETGSLVTAPSPYRFITIKNNKALVQSTTVKDIPSQTNFAEFAREYTKNGLEVLSKSIMDSYFVSKKDQEYIAPFISRAFLAHYKGDEKAPSIKEMLPDSNNLGLFGKAVFRLKKDLILGIWNDLPPGDNNIEIDLSKPYAE